MLSASFAQRLASVLILVCVSGISFALHAQSTEAELNARLKDKALYLRGCWRDDTLHFNSTGQLVGSSTPTSFTLSGFDLETLHLENDKLVLDGVRVGLKLANDKLQRVELKVNKGLHTKLENVHIEIEANSTNDYSQALDAIFSDGLMDMVPTLPSHWQSYAQKHFLSNGASHSNPPTTGTVLPKQQNSLPNGPRRIGDGIKPPILLKSVDLMKINDSARGMNHGEVKVLFNIWIEPDGSITHISVVRAMGLGIDEDALNALRQYVFAPGTLNGKPVLVELNIEMNHSDL